MEKDSWQLKKQVKSKENSHATQPDIDHMTKIQTLQTMNTNILKCKKDLLSSEE